MTQSNEIEKVATFMGEEVSTVKDLPDDVIHSPKLRKLANVEIPGHLKDPVVEEDLAHREFDDSRFWRSIPYFKDITREEFMDFRFQYRHSVNSVKKLEEIIGKFVTPEFLADVKEGIRIAPMNLRLTPYIVSLIDWKNPYDDPLRIQFIPVGSQKKPNHPKVSFDILHEQVDSPTPGLVHRYPDKVLFLPLDVCPVYCRYCTRSYAIGSDTGSVEKVDYKADEKIWEKAFAYIASRPEIEDVVVSGGDTYLLPHDRLRHIGETLLAIPHIRRIRVATKGPAVMPMKILTDEEWTNTLVDLVHHGRRSGKDVCLHTHFGCANEITEISREAMLHLFKLGVKVRNQTVIIRGVNDTPEKMISLVRQLAFMNVQPYYVYQHDMVRGVEELRTKVGDSLEVERHVRGTTAGFNTPTFVNDVPGGGGKRDLHSFDYYDPVTGVSVYRSPSVNPDAVYLYFDPLHLLPEEGRKRWTDPAQHDVIVHEAIEAAGLLHLKLTTE